ncbi:MAG: hypothetical protein HY548_02125, partial [Elusimicrobia bacterium]|nr:hypothetical protein [Elusimicrobiota bacterium]
IEDSHYTRAVEADSELGIRITSITKDTSIEEIKAGETGIYVFDYRTSQELLLADSKAYEGAFSAHVVDEIHAAVASNPMIKGSEANAFEKKTRSEQTEYYETEIRPREAIYDALAGEFRPHENAISTERQQFAFKEEVLKKAYAELTKAGKLNGMTYETFERLAQVLAKAMNMTKGKDYFIRNVEEENGILRYDVADDKGYKMEDTVFGDPELAGFVVMREAKDRTGNAALNSDWRMVESVGNNLIRGKTEEVTMLQVLEALGMKKGVYASGTLEGVRDTMEKMGVEKRELDPEVPLEYVESREQLAFVKSQAERERDPNRNTFEVSEKTDIIRVFEKIAELNAGLPEGSRITQVAVTSRNGNELVKIQKAIEAKIAELEGKSNRSSAENALLGTLKSFKDGMHVVDLMNEKKAADDLKAIKGEIKEDPQKSRLIISKGIGEGSNIFADAVMVGHRAVVIKLDLSPANVTLQTLKRVNAPGRADGLFGKILNLEAIKGDLTTQEYGMLSLSVKRYNLLVEMLEMVKTPQEKQRIQEQIQEVKGEISRQIVEIESRWMSEIDQRQAQQAAKTLAVSTRRTGYETAEINQKAREFFGNIPELASWGSGLRSPPFRAFSERLRALGIPQGQIDGFETYLRDNGCLFQQGNQSYLTSAGYATAVLFVSAAFSISQLDHDGLSNLNSLLDRPVGEGNFTAAFETVSVLVKSKVILLNNRFRGIDAFLALANAVVAANKSLPEGKKITAQQARQFMRKSDPQAELAKFVAGVIGGLSKESRAPLAFFKKFHEARERLAEARRGFAEISLTNRKFVQKREELAVKVRDFKEASFLGKFKAAFAVAGAGLSLVMADRRALPAMWRLSRAEKAFDALQNPAINTIGATDQDVAQITAFLQPDIAPQKVLELYGRLKEAVGPENFGRLLSRLRVNDLAGMARTGAIDLTLVTDRLTARPVAPALKWAAILALPVTIVALKFIVVAALGTSIAMALASLLTLSALPEQAAQKAQTAAVLQSRKAKLIAGGVVLAVLAAVVYFAGPLALINLVGLAAAFGKKHVLASSKLSERLGIREKGEGDFFALADSLKAEQTAVRGRVKVARLMELAVGNYKVVSSIYPKWKEMAARFDEVREMDKKHGTRFARAITVEDLQYYEKAGKFDAKLFLTDLMEEAERDPENAQAVEMAQEAEGVLGSVEGFRTTIRKRRFGLTTTPVVIPRTTPVGIHPFSQKDQDEMGSETERKRAVRGYAVKDRRRYLDDAMQQAEEEARTMSSRDRMARLRAIAYGAGEEDARSRDQRAEAEERARQERERDRISDVRQMSGVSAEQLEVVQRQSREASAVEKSRRKPFIIRDEMMPYREASVEAHEESLKKKSRDHLADLRSASGLSADDLDGINQRAKVASADEERKEQPLSVLDKRSGNTTAKIQQVASPPMKRLSMSGKLKSVGAGIGLDSDGSAVQRVNGASGIGVNPEPAVNANDTQEEERGTTKSIFGMKWGLHLWFAPAAEPLFQLPMLLPLMFGWALPFASIVLLVIGLAALQTVIFAYAHTEKVLLNGVDPNLSMAEKARIVKERRIQIAKAGLVFALVTAIPTVIFGFSTESLIGGWLLNSVVHFAHNAAVTMPGLMPTIRRLLPKNATAASILNVDVTEGVSLPGAMGRWANGAGQAAVDVAADLRVSAVGMETEEMARALDEFMRDPQNVERLERMSEGNMETPLMAHFRFDPKSRRMAPSFSPLRGNIVKRESVGRHVYGLRFGMDHSATAWQDAVEVFPDAFDGMDAKYAVPVHFHNGETRPSLSDVQYLNLPRGIVVNKKGEWTLYQLERAKDSNDEKYWNVATYTKTEGQPAPVVERTEFRKLYAEAMARGESIPMRFGAGKVDMPFFAQVLKGLNEKEDLPEILRMMGIGLDELDRLDAEIRREVRLQTAQELPAYVRVAVQRAYYLKQGMIPPDYIVQSQANQVMEKLDLTWLAVNPESVKASKSDLDAAVRERLPGFFEAMKSPAVQQAIRAEISSANTAKQDALLAAAGDADRFAGLSEEDQSTLLEAVAKGVLLPKLNDYVNIKVEKDDESAPTLEERITVKMTKDDLEGGAESQLTSEEVQVVRGRRTVRLRTHNIVLRALDKAIPVEQAYLNLLTALAHEAAHQVRLSVQGSIGMEAEGADAELVTDVLMKKALGDTELSLLSLNSERQFLSYLLDGFLRERNVLQLLNLRRLIEGLFHGIEGTTGEIRSALLKRLFDGRTNLVSFAGRLAYRIRDGFADKDIKGLDRPVVLLVNAKALVDEKGRLKEQVLMLLDDKLGADSKRLIHLGVVDISRIEDHVKEAFQDAAKYPSLAAALREGRIFFADKTNYYYAFIQKDGKINVQQLLYILMDEFNIREYKEVGVSIITNSAGLWNNEVKIHDKLIQVVVTLLEGVPLADVIDKALNYPPLTIIDVQA